MAARTPATLLAEAISALPSEIQVMIQEHLTISLIGARTIHVSGGFVAKSLNRTIKSSHHLCRAKPTPETTTTTSPPSDLLLSTPQRDDADSNARPHERCHSMAYTRERSSKLDTSILTLSRTFHARAIRLLYSTNKFSLSSIRALRVWLSSIPPSSRAHIQHIHLHVDFSEEKGYVSTFKRTPSQWRQYFADFDLQSQVRGLRSLDLEIELEGLVSCWRKTQGRSIAETFRVFQGLPRLRDLHVVVREGLVISFSRGVVLNCEQRVHEIRHHAMKVRESEEERRKLRDEWAREIRGVILGVGLEI